MRIPRTTLNEWKHQFDEFIPSSGEGRSKRYIAPAALEVFKTISKLKQAEKGTEQIAEVLQRSVPFTISEANEQQPNVFAGLLENIAIELKLANELKARELDIRLQEIQEQRQFRNYTLDLMDREVTKTLEALGETLKKSEGSSSTNPPKKWWWPFRK